MEHQIRQSKAFILYFQTYDLFVLLVRVPEELGSIECLGRVSAAQQGRGRLALYKENQSDSEAFRYVK